MDLTSGGSLQLEQTGINSYYVHNYDQGIGLYRCDRVIQNESSDSNGGSNMTCLFSAATCTLSHTTCHLYVDVALFFYDVTHNYVLWTEGVSEINY